LRGTPFLTRSSWHRRNDARFACQRCRLPCRRVNAMGRAIRGATVARARVVRGTKHGRIVFVPWERALLPLQEGTRACGRFDRCFCSYAAAITAGPLLAITIVAPPLAADRPVIVVPDWHCWAMRRAASSRGTGSTVEKTRHWREWRCGFLARSNRCTGCMTCGPGPSR
jgi:hypothetical protein